VHHHHFFYNPGVSCGYPDKIESGRHFRDIEPDRFGVISHDDLPDAISLDGHQFNECICGRILIPEYNIQIISSRIRKNIDLKICWLQMIN
jgi:hypothetical protein